MNMAINFSIDDESADGVEEYATENGLTIEETIAALVRFGLENVNRKQEVSGNVSGNVVQGRDFHGGLTIN